MANKPNIVLFYDTLTKILCNKYGIKMEYEIVPRRPEDGKALYRFD